MNHHQLHIEDFAAMKCDEAGANNVNQSTSTDSDVLEIANMCVIIIAWAGVALKKATWFNGWVPL